MRDLFTPTSRARIAATLDRELATFRWRLAIAVVLVGLHLFAFALAGRERLDLPFNAAPDEAPHFANPEAWVLGGYPREPKKWSRLIVSRWDAQVYIGFALRGLSSCPDAPGEDEPMTDFRYMMCGIGWFQAYGVAGGVVARTFGIGVDYALLALSVLAAIVVGLLWTSRTIVDRVGRFEAYATLLAYNMFPSAFYTVAPYTESATLAFVLGGVVCLAHKRWFAAALLVGAATSLRASAVSFAFAFGVTALVGALQLRRRASPDWWRPLAAAPLAAWGVITQFVVLQLAVGDWRAFTRARDIYGDHREYERLIDPVFYLKGFTAQHMDSVMLVGGTAMVLLVARALWRKLGTIEATFVTVASVAGIALAVTTVHEYWGLNRYLLLCPLLFLSLGMIARRYTLLFLGWLVVCALLYWHVELCSYITHGRPDLCPCLGRLEWWAPFAS